MDVNGTRFHLTLTEDEWLPPASTDEGHSARLGLEYIGGALRLRRLPPRLPPIETGTSIPAPSGRGAGTDRYDNVYWITETGNEIRVLGADWRVSQRFWPPDETAGAAAECSRGDFTPADPPPPAAVSFSGLTVTTEHYLVAGTEQPAGLLIFDLYGGGPPLALPWPPPVPFSPTDLASTTDGGLWALDRPHKSAWRLDRSLSVVPASPGESVSPEFTPASSAASAVTCAPASITRQAGLLLTSAVDPIAIQGLPDGSILILDNDPALNYSVIRRYRDGAPAGIRPLDHDLVDLFEQDGVTTLVLRGREMVFVPAQASPRRVTGTLYVAASAERQVFAYELTATSTDLSLRLLPRLFPTRAVTQHGLVVTGERVRYGFADRWLPLAEYPDARYVAQSTLELPVLSRAFDGKEPGCVWHRLLVDGAVPEDSEVVVESRASDEPELLELMPWQQEPRLYRRGDGAELPFYRLASTGQRGCGGTWELLLQSARGRFLQLRLTMRGHGRTSPRLHALRIYYPRFSYLRQYLPAVYRDDAGSADFLERYLANVEGILTAVEGRVADAQLLFDTRMVPVTSLSWLASWLGTEIEPAWSERTARLFLAHAARLFIERGTPAGVIRAVRLALEACVEESFFESGCCRSSGFGVRIVESYQLRRAPGVVFGNPTDLLGPGSTTDVSQWRPEQGDAPLHQQFRSFLASRYRDIEELNTDWGTTFGDFADPALRLPALKPTGAAQARDWQAFVQGAIGFTYAPVTDTDEPLFREFLGRRYPQVGDLNRAWGLSGGAALTSFAELKPRMWDAVLRSSLPASATALRDWVVFVSQVLPTARNAHRFVVLVPVALTDSLAQQGRKRDLADRVVQQEKPAHTQHEVRLYWGVFRVGEARVGLDTTVTMGSRSAALVLGGGVLGASHLGFPDRARTPDRTCVRN
jgi:phage tail-like protein